MVEGIDVVDTHVKHIILAMLKHVVVVLGYVPYKEISLLFSHLHGFSTSKTVELVVKTFLMFLETSSSWKTIFQELGLINTLSSLVIFIQKELEGVSTTPSWEGGKFILSPSITENFESIMALLDDMVRDEQNLQLFRNRTNSALLGLLRGPEYTKGAVSVIRNIILKVSGDPINPQDEFEQLLNVLKVSLDPITVCTILGLLKDLLEASTSIQTLFRKNKGYEKICLLIDIPSELRATFILHWFSVLFYSSNSNYENSEYLAEHGARLRFEAVLLKLIDTSNSTQIIGSFIAISTGIEVLLKNQETAFQTDLIIFDGTLLKKMLEFLEIISGEEVYQDLVLHALEWLLGMATSNMQNKSTLSNCGILHQIILWLTNIRTPISFEVKLFGSQVIGYERQLVSVLASISRQLCVLGIDNEELRLTLSMILSNKLKNPSFKPFLQDMILHTIKCGRTPDYFHFEPRISAAAGRLSIEDYGRAVPPQTGYSFLGWFNVQRFDPNSDIPLLTLVDQSGQERLLIYIERLTKSVVVRTLKGVLQMPNFVMPLNNWIHLAFVHHKPMLTASTINFYVNGSLICNEKCSYLGHPGSISSVRSYLGSFAHLPSAELLYSFDIGPLYFIGEHLIDAQTISIICDIGFEYTGNWQGSWAAYLVGNKSLQKKSTKLIEEEVQSPIFNQLATFAMSPTKNHQTHQMEIPEENFWLSISAKNLSSKIDINNAGASKNGNIIINGGISKPGSSSNTIKVEGLVMAICPKRIIEGIWTIGGCGILLRLVEDSSVLK